MSTDSRPGPFEGDTSEDLLASDVMIPVPRTCSPFSTVTEAAADPQGSGPRDGPGRGPRQTDRHRDRPRCRAGATSGQRMGHHRVSDVMNRQFPTAPADTPIDQVASMMADAGAPTLLVVDAEGMLTRGHLLD